VNVTCASFVRWAPPAVCDPPLADGTLCPDRLSSTPFKAMNNSSPGLPMPSDQNRTSSSGAGGGGQRPPAVSRVETRAVRSAAPPAPSPAPTMVTSGWPQLEPTPHLRRNAQPFQEPAPAVPDFASNSRQSPMSPGQMKAGGVSEQWGGAGITNGYADRKYDSFPASQSSDLDDIIQEIARNDQILELQSRLSSGEIEHEKQIKEFQRNQTVLEGMIKNLRLEVESERKKVTDLEKQLGTMGSNSIPLAESYEAKMRELNAQMVSERQRLESDHRTIRDDRDKAIRERDAALDKMNMFENDVRARLQALQAELERERLRRQELEQKNDTTVLRQVQTEKDLLERQNEDLTRQLIELKMLMRAESQQIVQPSAPAASQTIPSPNMRPRVATRAAAPGPRAPEEIPGLQMEAAEDELTSPERRQNDDVELHQSPSNAQFRKMRAQVNPAPVQSKGSPELAPSRSHADASMPDMSPQPQLISQQPETRYQEPSLVKPVAAAEAHRTAPLVPKLNLPRATTPTSKNASGIKAGIGMSFHPDPASGRFIITDVHPNGPAGQAVAQGSLVIGDALIAVNGASVQGMTVAQIVEDIVGPEGTPVLLTIARSYHGEISNQTVTLSLTRARPGGKAPIHSESNNQHSALETGSAHGRSGRRSRSSSPKIRGISNSPKISPVQRNSPKLSPVQSPQDQIVLPPGWVVEVDPSSGRTYYVNHTLKTFSWAQPGRGR